MPRIVSIANLQRIALEAPERSAIALEDIALVLRAIAANMGISLPDPNQPASGPEEPAPAYNPYTESAPGVPLPGQEKQ